MTIDKYTKFLLTLIAVGIIGINFHLFKGSVVKDAFAASSGDWHVVSGKEAFPFTFILRDGGSKMCAILVKHPSANTGKWVDSGC